MLDAAELVSELEANPSLLNDVDKDGCTLLLQYVKDGKLGACKTLIGLIAPADRLAAIEVVDKNGRGSVHHAALRGRLAVLRVLLGLGADANGIDVKGFRPLHLCSDATVAKCLIDSGADVLCRNKMGRSALQHMAFVGLDNQPLLSYLKQAEVGLDENSFELTGFANLATNGTLSAVLFAAVLSGALAYYLAMYEDDEAYFAHHSDEL